MNNYDVEDRIKDVEYKDDLLEFIVDYSSFIPLRICEFIGAFVEKRNAGGLTRKNELQEFFSELHQNCSQKYLKNTKHFERHY